MNHPFSILNRYTRALGLLASNQKQQWSNSVDQLLIEAGYSSQAEFWSDMLSEQYQASEFIKIICEFQLSTTLGANEEILRERLEARLWDARTSKQAWVFRYDGAPYDSDEIEYYGVNARYAAEWLLQSNLCRDLVPDSLRLFLETSHQTSVRPSASAPKAKKVKARAKSSSDSQAAEIKRRAAELLPSLRRDDVVTTVVREFNVARPVARELVNSPRSRGQQIKTKYAK